MADNHNHDYHDKGCKGCSYCSDAYGVILDANAEAGREPYDPEGYYDARKNGWLESE